jgi:hypothetical protein
MLLMGRRSQVLLLLHIALFFNFDHLAQDVKLCAIDPIRIHLCIAIINGTGKHIGAGKTRTETTKLAFHCQNEAGTAKDDIRV